MLHHLSTGGREKIIKTTEVCKDDVFDHLRSPDLDKDFLYHTDNECSKCYTMLKSCKSVKQWDGTGRKRAR